MKIIRDGKVYVQKKDLDDLLNVVSSLSILVPPIVLDKVFIDIFICFGNDMYDFLPFDGDEMINFFKGLDYIVDYDDLKDKTKEEIIIYIESIDDEINKIAFEFNQMNEKTREQEFEKINSLCYSKKLKMNAARDFLLFKEGKLNFNIPTIDNDIDNQKNNLIKEKKELGIKQLVKSIFNKR